jgi:hypothetical protein
VEDWKIEDRSFDDGTRVRHLKRDTLASAGGTVGGIVGDGKGVTEIVRKRVLLQSDMRGVGRDYDMRLSLKEEMPRDQPGLHALENRRRMTTRRSFFPDGAIRVDLSIVQQQEAARHHATPPAPPTTRFECEIELLPEAAARFSDAQLVALMRAWAYDLLDAVARPSTPSIVIAIPAAPSPSSAASPSQGLVLPTLPATTSSSSQQLITTPAIVRAIEHVATRGPDTAPTHGLRPKEASPVLLSDALLVPVSRAVTGPRQRELKSY